MASPLVLVVEDDPLLMMSTCDALRALGLAVVKARTVDDGVAILEAVGAEIAVVLSDIKTPGQRDGLFFAQEIKRSWPRVRLVLTSGRVVPKAAALEANVHFFEKPCDYTEVAGLVAVLADVDPAAPNALRPALETELLAGGTIDRHLGRRLCECRVARGMGQFDLASRVGVSLDLLQSYERGVIRIPAATLIALVRALGVRPADLFRGLTY